MTEWVLSGIQNYFSYLGYFLSSRTSGRSSEDLGSQERNTSFLSFSVPTAGSKTAVPPTPPPPSSRERHSHREITDRMEIMPLADWKSGMSSYPLEKQGRLEKEDEKSGCGHGVENSRGGNMLQSDKEVNNSKTGILLRSLLPGTH